VSYQSQAQLEADYWFQQRSRATAIQQAESFKDDQRPNYVALAEAVLRDAPGPVQAFTRLGAAGPGIAEKVDSGDGSIDSSLVTDADLLSLTQANWQVVAPLYFNDDGTPIEGA
jgi:hypothetical protein